MVFDVSIMDTIFQGFAIISMHQPGVFISLLGSKGYP
jgi:hypothetical protein